MNLTIISDTHSQQQKLQLGSGDVLLHCGDFTNRGSIEDTQSFAQFIAAQNYKTKIVIAGNHDFCFEDARQQQAEKCLTDLDIVYLNDSGVEIDGVRFWGSPIQPEFMDWAFMRARGKDIREHWDKIPLSTDVLLTHGPPLGILDAIYDGTNVGCKDLLDKVKQVKPKVHAFGHIHESYGTLSKHGVQFVNASNADLFYHITNEPIIVDI